MFNELLIVDNLRVFCIHYSPISNAMTAISGIYQGSFGVEDIERAMWASPRASGGSADKGICQLRASAVEGYFFPVVTQERLPGAMGWTLPGEVPSIECPAKDPCPAPAVMHPCSSRSCWATTTWGTTSQPWAHGGAQCPGMRLHLLQRLPCDCNIKHRNKTTKSRFCLMGGCK